MKIEVNSPEYYQLVERLKVQLKSIPPDEEIDKTFNTVVSIMYHSKNEFFPDTYIISKANAYGLIDIDELFT